MKCYVKRKLINLKSDNLSHFLQFQVEKCGDFGCKEQPLGKKEEEKVSLHIKFYSVIINQIYSVVMAQFYSVVGEWGLILFREAIVFQYRSFFNIVQTALDPPPPLERC